MGQSPVHIRRRMQHVCGNDEIVGGGLDPLFGRRLLDIEQPCRQTGNAVGELPLRMDEKGL